MCHTNQLIGDFVPNFGEKGPKSKTEEQRFVEGSWRNDGQKMASIPSRNKKEEAI